jgi:hypothetical protein
LKHISTRSVLAYAMTVAALGATLAGCGGSSSGGGDDSAGATLARADLVEQANAICAAEETEGEKIEPPANIQDADEAAAYFDQVDPLISETTDKLAALKPDSEVAADWNAFLDLRKEFTTLMHTVREKADAADRSGLDDLRSSQGLTDRVKTAAEKVGADTCGSA